MGIGGNRVIGKCTVGIPLVKITVLYGIVYVKGICHRIHLRGKSGYSGRKCVIRNIQRGYLHLIIPERRIIDHSSAGMQGYAVDEFFTVDIFRRVCAEFIHIILARIHLFYTVISSVIQFNPGGYSCCLNYFITLLV